MPCPSWVTNTSTVLDLTALLVGVATVLTAGELLSLRTEFRREGLFDPQLLRATGGGLTKRIAPVSMPSVAGAELVLAVVVLVFLAAGMTPAIPLLALAPLTLLQRSLLPYGGEGSDDMGRILTITVTIAFALSGTDAVLRIAFVFIAAQLCLAYGASGVAKLFGRRWRSGTAVQGILHTAFGHPGWGQSALDRWPAAGKALTWLVIAFEVGFPLGIVLGGWFATTALAVAAAFQVSIAVLLGLNRFTPWFLAAFPATAWSACHYGLLS